MVQTERKSMGVKEVNQSFYEQALEEVLRTRHDRVLGMYRLFALQNRHHYCKFRKVEFHPIWNLHRVLPTHRIL